MCEPFQVDLHCANEKAQLTFGFGEKNMVFKSLNVGAPTIVRISFSLPHAPGTRIVRARKYCRQHLIILNSRVVMIISPSLDAQTFHMQRKGLYLLKIGAKVARDIKRLMEHFKKFIN